MNIQFQQTTYEQQVYAYQSQFGEGQQQKRQEGSQQQQQPQQQQQQQQSMNNTNGLYDLFGFKETSNVVPGPWAQWKSSPQTFPSGSPFSTSLTSGSLFPESFQPIKAQHPPHAQDQQKQAEFQPREQGAYFDSIIHPPFSYSPQHMDSQNELILNKTNDADSYRDDSPVTDAIPTEEMGEDVFHELSEEMFIFSEEPGEDESVDDTNVFVKHLPSDIDDNDLRELFSRFGKICSCKVMLNIKTGGSLGYGFIRYQAGVSAVKAIDTMSGYRIGKKKLLCKLSNKAQPQRQKQSPRKNLYVKHLPMGCNDESLRVLFEKFGEIVEVKVMMDKHTGLSKQIGFVRFKHQQHATDALLAMNGKQLDTNGGPTLAVQYAETPSEKRHRQTLQQAKLNALSYRSVNSKTIVHSNGTRPSKVQSSVGVPFPTKQPKIDTNRKKKAPKRSNKQITPSSDSPKSPQHQPAVSPTSQKRRNQPKKNSKANVFIFHLPPKVGDEGLYNLFRPFGEVESVRVIIDPQTGQSKGYGFVKYYHPEDAQRAVDSMSGYRLGNKYLKVSFKS